MKEMKVEDILNLDMLTNDDKEMLFHMVQAQESLYGITALCTNADSDLEKTASDAAIFIEAELVKRYSEVFRWDRLIKYLKDTDQIKETR